MTEISEIYIRQNKYAKDPYKGCLSANKDAINKEPM